jgi:Na+/H+ antiporter NhaD/arsenite permease-like protein
VLTGTIVFVATYLLIAGRRLQFMPLDRPAGALLGAVACVALGVLTPGQALAAIDGQTLVLLFGLMGVGAYLSEGGLIDRAALWVARWAATPTRLLGALVWSAGGLAALVTNDAVCVIGAPVVVAWIVRHRLPPLPFLLALATAANTGSVATLVGNPQNMLCASLGGLVYRSYALHLLPVAVVGLALNHALLAWLFRRELAAAGGLHDAAPAAEAAPVTAGRGNRNLVVTLLILVGTVVAYLAGADLAWTAVAAFTLLMIVRRADPAVFWGRIDWSVILFFGGLFVVVEGLVRSGGAGWLLARFPIYLPSADALAAHARTAVIFLVGSNVVSNVPFILVVQAEMARLPNPTLGWELLAMASTFAGNLTLLGSVANIIVAERGREVGGLPFLAYLRVGLPLAVATTALGTLWLLFVHGAF